MKVSLLIMTILILLISFVYFQKDKYIQLEGEKEDFKNIIVYKLD